MLYSYSNRNLLCWWSDMMEMVVVGPGQAQHWSKFWMLAPKLEIKVLWFSSVLRSSSVAATSVVVMFSELQKKKMLESQGQKSDIALAQWMKISLRSEKRLISNSLIELFTFKLLMSAICLHLNI